MPRVAMRKAGFAPGTNIPGRQTQKGVHPTTAGTYLYVVWDNNNISTAGWGDNSGTHKLYVYERTGTAAPVLRATITPPWTVGIFSTAIDQNNNLHIAVRSYDANNMQYYKVAYAGFAVTTSAIGAAAGTNDSFGSIDIDVSPDGSNVYVAFQFWRSTGALFAGVRWLTGSTWRSLNINNEVTSGSRSLSREAIGICVASTAATTAGYDKIIVCSGEGSTKSDQGCKVFVLSCSKTDGTTSGLKKVITYDAGQQASSSLYGSRRIYLVWDATHQIAVLGLAKTLGNKVANVVTLDWNADQSSLIRRDIDTLTPGYASTNMRNPQFSYQLNADGSLGFLSIFYMAKNDSRIGASNWYVSNYMWTMKWNATSRTMKPFHEDHSTFDYANVDVTSIAGGSNRQIKGANTDVPILYRDTKTNRYTYYASWNAASDNLDGGSAVVQTTPSDGAALTTTAFTYSSKVHTGQYREQSRYYVEYQFATDPAFSNIVLDDRRVPTSNGQRTQVWNTDAPNARVQMPTLTPPNASVFHSGYWYMRARLVNQWEQVGSWTPTRVFTIGHPPVLVPTAPKDNVNIANYDGTVILSWDFRDTSAGDYQSAYQVQMFSAVDNSLVYDSGQIVSGNHYHTVTPPANGDYYWKVLGWDSEGTPGVYSDSAYFSFVAPTTVTISEPLDNTDVDTGVPNIVFSADRDITAFYLTVFQSGTVVYATVQSGTIPAGASHTVQIPAGYLANHQQYSFQIVVDDIYGNKGTSSIISFGTEWTPPASPSVINVDTSTYNQEDEGYILVSWDDVPRDAGDTLLSWTVYRQDDLIDPFTKEVIESGTPQLVYEAQLTSDVYSFKDFFAPSGYKVSYSVHQVVLRDIQTIESEDDHYQESYPVSDGYWIIQPNDDATDASAFKLGVVTSDSFTDEQEEEEFTVIGKGRVVNKGDSLGPNGTLNVQIRNTQGSTARDKVLRLRNVQKEVAQLWLRNPFGDAFKVNVSGIQFDRIAGVGNAEYVDAQIPYYEVG